MIIGTASFRLQIPAAQSLKDKRQVLRSVLARVRNEFNVSIAEVGDQDRHRISEIGVAVVATDQRHAHQQLQAVLNFIAELRPDCPLLDIELEML